MPVLAFLCDLFWIIPPPGVGCRAEAEDTAELLPSSQINLYFKTQAPKSSPIYLRVMEPTGVSAEQSAGGKLGLRFTVTF